MFTAMMEAIKEESVGYLFNLEVEVQENPIVEEEDTMMAETRSIIARGLRGPERPAELEYTAPGEAGDGRAHPGPQLGAPSAPPTATSSATRPAPVARARSTSDCPRRPQERAGVTRRFCDEALAFGGGLVA